ncbi:hypothetical protein RI845_11400 [Thalassotalea nanhaiensis]|uniref:Uncharacterized protein n=1 Tax=Thalassotalea nanhaiensis TaxID=3065648 RepID=A0ABY9TH65_9GAMM|nr:hypothetical protein RI845_11400 [Colwelliaceae bacterium SQ345]
MKIVYILTYLMSFVFILGETLRRGLSYFSINATTMVEDYLCGLLLLTAAVLWTKGSQLAEKYMVAAWAYTTGGMFVPFYAHLEAYLRGATFRADHPHTDVNSVILKGIIWSIALICFLIVIKSQTKSTEKN